MLKQVLLLTIAIVQSRYCRGSLSRSNLIKYNISAYRLPIVTRRHYLYRFRKQFATDIVGNHHVAVLQFTQFNVNYKSIEVVTILLCCSNIAYNSFAYQFHNFWMTTRLGRDHDGFRLQHFRHHFESRCLQPSTQYISNKSPTFNL